VIYPPSSLLIHLVLKLDAQLVNLRAAKLANMANMAKEGEEAKEAKESRDLPSV